MKIIIRNIFCFAVLFFSMLRNVEAQPLADHPVLTDASDFNIIQKEMNDFYAAHPKAVGYKQWKRREWFLEPRLYPSGKMENLALKTWKEYDRYLKSQPDSRATHGSWGFLGPTSHPIGLGRINSIAFHPTDDDIMYIGSANGGVWKTINGGDSWQNISPNLPLLAVADVKISPTNPNVIYVLTGDGDPLPTETSIHTQTEISSMGILRSPDGGATWHPSGFNIGHPSLVFPTKLLIHPSNVNIQYIVSDQGIYRTTDHWENFTIDWGNLTYDIEFKPDNPNIMYASGDNEIIKSTDGGDTWNTVTDADFSFGSASRIELAVAPNNANIVYALVGNWGGFIEFFQSASQGNNNSWTSQNTSAGTFGNFTDYCVALAVDPTDFTDVFGGMQWINRSLNSGTSWTSVVDNFVHADIHDVAYENGALWVCCDGGLYKSTDEGNNWTDLTDGLAITEMYRITGTPLNANLYYSGCQDNGTMKRNGVTTAFDIAFGNDGMTPMINYENSNIVYISWQNGNFEKSTTGGGDGSFSPLTIPGGNGNWVTPCAMDPVNPDTIFVGKTSVYRSNDGGSNWQNLGSPAGALLNCLAQGISNRNRMYASSGTLLYRTDNALVNAGAATWTNIGAGVPNLAITGIAIDPANSLRAFVSLSGYTDGQKVYRTTDGGANWDNISGSLPDVPVNCIVFDENGTGADALYIGTDIGVFYRDNSLGDWIYYSNFLPVVMVSDLYLNDNDNTLVAGTYGRGLWRTNKYDGCVANISLSNLFGFSVGGVRFYTSTNSITSSAIYDKEIGTEVHYTTGNYIDLTTDFTAGAQGFFEGKLGPCPAVFVEPYMSPFVSTSKLIMQGFEKAAETSDRPR